MKKYNNGQIVSILTPFVICFAFGLDIYIPIVPQISQIFRTSSAMVQLTLSLFLFTIGLGQLLIGPLSDRLGRKIIFVGSALIFTGGAGACALSTNIWQLIIGRLICATGACGLLVNSFAIVRDIHGGVRGAKIYSFLNGAIGISPTFAPLLGGFLAFYFGWSSVFIFLMFLGMIAFFVSLNWIEETLPPEKRIKMDAQIMDYYREVFIHPLFLASSCLGGVAEATFFCFFSLSPFIIIENLQVSMQNFGYYFAFFGVIMTIGGFVGGKLIETVGTQKTAKLGIAMILVGGAAMLGYALLASLSLWNFLLPMMIACTGAVFLLGVSAASALAPFQHIAGIASAAFGFIGFSIASGIGSLLMLFSTTTTLPYAIILLVIGSIALGFHRFIYFKLKA